MFDQNWSDDEKKDWRKEGRQYLEKWLDRVLYDQELTAGEKVTATAYLRFFNFEKREAWPSYAAVAERCGTSPETVRKHVGKLKKKGYLYFRGQMINGSGGYGSNRYKIGLPEPGEDFDWLHQVKRRPQNEEKLTTPPERGRYEDTGGPVPGDHPSGITVPGVRYEDTANSLEGLSGKTLRRDSQDLACAHLTDGPELSSIHHFIEIEREHRDELINYWIDALDRLDHFACVREETTYQSALSAFVTAFEDTTRRDWIGTFKFFMNAAASDPDVDSMGMEMGDGFLYLEESHAEDKKIRDGKTWQDFRDAFQSPPQPVQDKEYRRIWERLLLEVNAPLIWAALAGGKGTAGKFPREFEDKLVKAHRSRAASKVTA